MNKRRTINIIIFLFLILFISVGYAYLNSNVTINGSSTIASSRWNVYWDNVQVKNGSVEASTPSIVNQSTVTFDITLAKPGDFYEFTVDAKNDGTMDAMIDNITKTINNNTTVPTYLNYEVTYADGVDIVPNHILAANSFETVRVRVEFKRDIEQSDLPTTPETLNLSFGVTYVQENENSIPVRETVYTVSNTEARIGLALPNITTYDNYQEALSNIGRPMFLKHIIANDTVISSHIGFVINNSVYYIRGGVYEAGAGDDEAATPIFESNKAIMQNAFGEENCGEWSNGYYRNITCIGPNVSAYAATDGYVDSGIPNDCECYIHVGGKAACTC